MFCFHKTVVCPAGCAWLIFRIDSRLFCSCTTLVYCKSFNVLGSLSALAENFAKLRTIFELTKFFSNFFWFCIPSPLCFVLPVTSVPKASAKLGTFRELPKFFGNYFSKKITDFSLPFLYQLNNFYACFELFSWLNVVRCRHREIHGPTHSKLVDFFGGIFSAPWSFCCDFETEVHCRNRHERLVATAAGHVFGIPLKL